MTMIIQYLKDMIFFVILFVVGAVLKMAGVIAWSWWLVCSPLLVMFIICFSLFISSVIEVIMMIRKEERDNLENTNIN